MMDDNHHHQAAASAGYYTNIGGSSSMRNGGAVLPPSSGLGATIASASHEEDGFIFQLEMWGTTQHRHHLHSTTASPRPRTPSMPWNGCSDRESDSYDRHSVAMLMNSSLSDRHPHHAPIFILALQKLSLQYKERERKRRQTRTHTIFHSRVSRGANHVKDSCYRTDKRRRSMVPLDWSLSYTLLQLTLLLLFRTNQVSCREVRCMLPFDYYS